MADAIVPSCTVGDAWLPKQELSLGVCAFFVGEVPTGGTDTVVTLVAVGAYVDALQNYKRECLAT